MELRDYTTKELKNELYRRRCNANELKCRNCEHMVTVYSSNDMKYYKCGKRTIIENGRVWARDVKPSQAACENYCKRTWRKRYY